MIHQIPTDVSYTIGVYMNKTNCLFFYQFDLRKILYYKVSFFVLTIFYKNIRGPPLIDWQNKSIGGEKNGI